MKMIKTILLGLLGYFLAFIVLYLVHSFAFMTFDISGWTNDGRSSTAILTIFFGSLLQLFMHKTIRQNIVNDYYSY